MSWKGKRSSILKKQPSILGPSSNENGSPTATCSSVCKSGKKIGFHHKKSIKEFDVGENTATIWGNSYEVSADGTSPRIAIDDTTLTNGHDQSKPNLQNKENVSCIVPQPSVDSAISYPSPETTPDHTWDLSITIADDERRRIRSDNSVCASQSLNTTERLMVEPPCTQPPALAKSLNKVQAIDVSPMKLHASQTAAVKSPRKMIYYNPQEDLFVNIADVPAEAVNRVEQQTQAKGPEQSTNLTCFQPNDDCSAKHSMLGNETWNSHPQAAFRMKQSRPSFDTLADASSDFDNTVAITNTVAKLLEDCPNLTLSVPSNMELDESTVTDVKLPTNALSRARPSFLPSDWRRRSCAMEEEQTETTNTPLKGTKNETLSSAHRLLIDPVPMDISSPLEGRPTVENFTPDNLSISGDDIQQSVAAYRRSSVKSSGLPMDFRISSMSLKLSPNSPEPLAAVGRPKILRPNFPFTTLYNAASNLKPDPSVPTETDTPVRQPGYRETILTATEMDETKQVEWERGESLAPMDVTHVEQPNRTPVEPKRPSRATVHQPANMSDDDGAILAAPSQSRTTVLSRETMQLSHRSPPTGTAKQEKRHTVYDQPLIDETLADPTVDRKRGTTHEPVTMSETKRTTASETKHNTFADNTITEEQMILQEPLGVTSIHPSASRQTIFCNESMVMDGNDPSISRGTSIACVVYSENIDSLSVHAENKATSVDLKIARATVHDPEPCVLDSLQESAKRSSDRGAIRDRRATTCVPVAMDEEPLEKETPNDGRQGRLPIINETTEERSVRSPGPPFRATLHQWEHMDETNKSIEQQDADGRMELTTCCRSSPHEEPESVVPKPSEGRTRCTTFQRMDMDETKVVDHHGEDKQSKISRKTIYCRAEMDETCAEAAQVYCPKIEVDTHHLKPTTRKVSAMEETLGVRSTKTVNQTNGASSVGNSPMNMSPAVVIDLSKNNTRTTEPAVVAPVQRSRQSIYQPCDMEQTVPVNLVVTQRKEDRKGEPVSESMQRTSVLRMIVQQTPKEDMEGFSILTDDDDRGMIGNGASDNQNSSKKPRATVFFTETAGRMDETATAANADRHQPREENRLTGHEAVAMEEATCVLPKAHHLAYSTADGNRASRLSIGQRKSSVCMEETLAPSDVRIERSGPRFDDSSDRPLSPDSEAHRGTICPKQDAMDTTKVNPVTIPSTGQQTNEASGKDQPVKVRPRQTILIPQDMEIEEHEQLEPEPAVMVKEESFSLPMLVRETTEDCVIRCAPSMATAAGRALASGMFATDAFGLKAHKSLSDSVSRMTITKHGDQHQQWLTSYTHQPIDISASTSYLRTEPSEIGNISGHAMSMREIVDPLAEISGAVGHRAQGNTTKDRSKSIAPEPPLSEDEFFDAETDQGHPVSGEDTSRAMTKSRQFLQSMKFIDVEQLEHTRQLECTAKRVHARLVSSPIVERSEKDPLHVTQLVHQRTAEQMTPQGPSTKKTRVSQSPQATTVGEAHTGGQEIVNSTAPYEPELVLIKQETEELASVGTEAVRPSQTLILDPSVFEIDEEDLLDDESKLPSLTDEHLGAYEAGLQESDSDSERSSHRNRRPSKDVSYYRDFANVTLNGLEPASSDEEDEPALVAAVRQTQQEQGQDTLVVEVGECITISDDSATEPLAVSGDRTAVSGRVLDSSLASAFLEELRLKYPSKPLQSCCGKRGDCLCRAKRKLERQKKANEEIWNRLHNKLENIPRPPTTNSLEEKWDELWWQISQIDFDAVPRHRPEASTAGKPTPPIRTIFPPPFCGMYPETPDPMFLIRNFRQCLAEQRQANNDRSPGATLPEVPRITKLIANKLATETQWKLDHSEEMLLDHLVLRHRTLRSVTITIQFEPESVQRERLRQLGLAQEDAEDHRVERIQVEECLREYVHTPKLLLAHIHFIQLTKQTTEQTLLSTYRTAGSLMGLWRHFHDLLGRVFDAVNRLVTIVDTAGGLLSYDVTLERFCVKKLFRRTDQEGFVEPNAVLVHFTSLAGIGASGVGFKHPFPDAFHLLPPHTIVDDQSSASGSDFGNARSGLMFLECLLWNVSKQYET